MNRKIKTEIGIGIILVFSAIVIVSFWLGIRKQEKDQITLNLTNSQQSIGAVANLSEVGGGASGNNTSQNILDKKENSKKDREIVPAKFDAEKEAKRQSGLHEVPTLDSIVTLDGLLQVEQGGGLLVYYYKYGTTEYGTLYVKTCLQNGECDYEAGQIYLLDRGSKFINSSVNMKRIRVTGTLKHTDDYPELRELTEAGPGFIVVNMSKLEVLGNNPEKNL